MLCRIAKAKKILDVRCTMLLSSSAMSNEEIYDVSRSGKSKSEFEVPRGPAVMLLSTKLGASSDERRFCCCWWVVFCLFYCGWLSLRWTKWFLIIPLVRFTVSPLASVSLPQSSGYRLLLLHILQREVQRREQCDMMEGAVESVQLQLGVDRHLYEADHCIRAVELSLHQYSDACLPSTSTAARNCNWEHWYLLVRCIVAWYKAEDWILQKFCLKSFATRMKVVSCKCNRRTTPARTPSEVVGCVRLSKSEVVDCIVPLDLPDPPYKVHTPNSPL